MKDKSVHDVKAKKSREQPKIRKKKKISSFFSLFFSKVNVCVSVYVDKRENAIKWWGVGEGNDSYFPLLLFLFFFLSMKRRIGGKRKKNGDRLIYIDFWTQRAEKDTRERKASIQKRKNSIPMRGIFLISFGK